MLPLLVCVAVTAAVVAVPFPTARLASSNVESRRIYDRHGVLLRESLSEVEGRGVWRVLDQVSPWVPLAFVAVEDHRFASHPGVDPVGIVRAARDNLRAGRIVSGGSTITQQVVQLVSPQPRTLWGKAAEALWAMRLERVVDKAVILEQYVNRAPFGHRTFGIEAAARLYFGRAARDLSLAEAALLVGIPRAPSLNNPFTDADRARSRQRVVLRRMVETGVIDVATGEDALAESLRLARPDDVFRAPHFTEHLLRRATGRGGDLHTTLDGGLQVEVEGLVRATLRSLEDREVDHAAAIVLDNATGDVLAWVGSGDFFSPRDGQVDMVTSRRQPGSTLKPFLYGLAFEDGLSPAERIADVPIWFPTASGDYRPRNYDRRYHGEVSPRIALANSYNVPAVWLAWRLGVGTFHARLRALGFESLDRAAGHYGLGLALGNGEVRLIELANAYRAVANEGVTSPVRWWRDDPPAPRQRVMPASAARLVTDILADPVARVPAFGRHGPLTTPFPSAVKTGTSTDFTDNWTVGFTSEVTVGVWVGNFDGRPMAKTTGVSGAAPLWHRIVRTANRGRPARSFSRAGLRRVTLCAETGEVFGPGCDHPMTEWVFDDGPTGRKGAKPSALSVAFPDDGDAFALSTDVPIEYAQIALRAHVPPGIDRLVWAIDDRRIAESGPPFLAWWTPAPGEHTARVWPRGRPDAKSRAVRFRVVD